MGIGCFLLYSYGGLFVDWVAVKDDEEGVQFTVEDLTRTAAEVEE